MKKIDLGQTLQIVANVGVIAGIVFLAVELQQNTDSQRMMAAQQVFGVSNASIHAGALDEDMNKLMVALRADDDLTEIQQAKYRSLLFAWTINHWQVYYQSQNGFIDQEISEAYERRTVDMLSNRYARQWWTESKWRFAESYQEFVDGLLADEAP
jgi:hypothetical protein